DDTRYSYHPRPDRLGLLRDLEDHQRLCSPSTWLSTGAWANILFDNRRRICCNHRPLGLWQIDAADNGCRLQAPDEGTIQLAGEPITKPGRRLGVVFQQHVLLPWLSAKQNVLFALQANGDTSRTGAEQEKIAEYWLDQV